jgi:hypothetical protein
VDEVVSDEKLIKDVNLISLKERPAEDVEGDEFTSNSLEEEEFASPQDEGLNEPEQDRRKERPQRQCKYWPCD